jgi:hypothetical protein
MSGHQSLHHTPQSVEFSFAHAALHCGQSERATSTAAALCSLSASGEVVVTRASSLVTSLRRLQRIYKLQFHYAAGRCAAIRLDNPFVTIIEGKAPLSLYRRPHQTPV